MVRKKGRSSRSSHGRGHSNADGNSNASGSGNSSSGKKSKNITNKSLNIDCSSLFNHLNLIEKSLQLGDDDAHSTSSSTSTSSRMDKKPTLQMLNFQSYKHHQLQDWYILVASTPHAISAQLINVPNDMHGHGLPDVVVPDLIQCTPVSVWTSPPPPSPLNDDDDDDGNAKAKGIREVLNCKPIIITQEPSTQSRCTSQEYLQVGIVVGTNHPYNRVLSLQLSIYSYVGFSGIDEGRYVLSKSMMATSMTHGDDGFGSGSGGRGHGQGRYEYESVIEPLPLDTEEDVRRRKRKLALEEHSSSHNNNEETSAATSTGASTASGSASNAGNMNINTTGHSRQSLEDSVSATSASGTGNGAGAGSTSASASTAHAGMNTSTDGEDGAWVPFRPSGGVISVSSLYRQIHRRSGNGNGSIGVNSGGDRNGRTGISGGEGYYMWITYGDGTLVRLPRWAFFALDELEPFDDTDSAGASAGNNNSDGNGNGNGNGATNTTQKRIQNDRNHATAIANRKRNLYNAAVKAKIDLQTDMDGCVVIVPLPRFYPTLLSQPLESDGSFIMPTLVPDYSQEDDDEDGSDEDGSDDDRVNTSGTSTSILDASRDDGNGKQVEEYEFYEAVSYKDEHAARQKAAANANGNNNSNMNIGLENFPTLAFYTNENQLLSNTHKNVEKEVNSSSTAYAVQNLIRGGTTIIGGTAAIARGMLGGVLRGVLGRGRTSKNKQRQLEKEEREKLDMNGMEIIGGVGMMEDAMHDADRSTRSSLFPALHQESTIMSLGTALYDAPRQITHVSIDPIEGKLMACCDNLGRVQLIDLATKQVLRMWKGFRESTTHWIQFPHVMDDEIHLVKYLAIHSRQRNVVEIYRLVHGPRVGKFDVKFDGANIVQCSVNLEGGELYERCFLLQNNNNGGGGGFIAKELTLVDDELRSASVEYSNNTYAGAGGDGSTIAPHQQPMVEGTIQLQLLKQLLASESAVPSDLDAVYAALTQITAISDLSKALDLLALATHLEEGMGVKGSSFHMEVVLHAEEQLDIALSDESLVTSRNPLLEDLMKKIEFHGQLISAYDELFKFENGEYCDNDAESTATTTSSWAEEAVAWIDTYEEVTKQSIDNDLANANNDDGSKLKFAVFAKGCLQDQAIPQRNDKGKLKVFLCDSTRDRKLILLHLFRPLTKDIFVCKVTQRIFEHMGINDDFDKLLQYYGEWFMSLQKEVAEGISDGIWCPAVRWLHNVVLNYLQSEECEEAIKEDRNLIILEALHIFCAEAADLPRAFLLAAVCHDAIAAATKKIDDKTYGLVTCQQCVKPWQELLRKLRVCLLVSLRLYGIPLGSFPITLANVDKGDIFSVYQWIAHDEVSLSHKSRELVGLESMCRTSSLAFSPSLKEGDDRWTMLQISCTERHSVKNFVPADADAPGPLLLFLKQYNDSRRLASHRALVLAQCWGREPDSLHLLDDALTSLRSIDNMAILSATLQEIWNTNLRPIYRGLLFGFHEVHEVAEETISPLCEDLEWFQHLNKISMGLINLLRSTVDAAEDESTESSTNIELKPGVWPPLQQDHIIDNLVARACKLDDASLEVHRGVICALQLSNDLSMLPLCIPSFEELFERNSFVQHISVPIPPNEYQIAFIDTALQLKASHVGETSVNRSILEDVVSLGRSWGMDKSMVLTQFLLVMYELGKDETVEDLANRSSRLIEVETFLQKGIPIVCVRLHAAIITLKKARCRGILAMLDADTCEWVKEQAVLTEDRSEDAQRIHFKDENGRLLSLLNTHALILRIKRMSSVNRIDAYALSVMCETLLKAADKTDILIA